MHSLSLFVLVVLLYVLCCSLSVSARPPNDKLTAVAFSAFMRQYNRVYSSPEETELRYNTFKRNYQLVQEHKQNNPADTFSIGINQFADRAESEMEQIMNRRLTSTSQQRGSHSRHRVSVFAPNLTELDWRTKGAVAPVKDQGQCGAAWPWPVTGAIEGAMVIHTGKQLVELSTQELLDCVHPGQGCDSQGTPDEGYQWVIDHKGICSAAAYPSHPPPPDCKPCSEPSARISSYEKVKFDPEHPNHDDDLLAGVNLGLVSVAVEADRPAFQLYTGGILNNAQACGTQLNHVLLIVGYGVENGVDFWIAQNSWGAAWGEKGYVRLARHQNMCGINMDATYPILESQ